MLEIFYISRVFVIIATNTTVMARRFTADEVLQEVIADNDSNDEDFMDEVDTSFIDIRSNMDSNISLEGEGNVFDSISEVEEGIDSEFVPESSTFSEASEGSEDELNAIDEMGVEIATNQVPSLSSNNGSIPVAAPELPQSIPVAAPELPQGITVAAPELPQSIPVAASEMFQRGRGQRGRGRRGRGRARTG